MKRDLLQERTEHARTALHALYGELRERGLGAPASADGQLIRPLLSLAGAEALGLPHDGRFWSATAAVQLAHEASLLHDDVIDAAAMRRAEPTLAAAKGVAAALVEGDHLLTTSYRLAAATDSAAFFAAFAHAVERTVAGEKLQGRASGLELDESTYRRIIAGKSGELLGCALAAAAYAAAHPAAASLYVLGRRVGELYQMLDDLLDYFPDVDTGKPALADYRQKRWTWPLRELRIRDFELDPQDVSARFTQRDDSGTTPLARCLERYEREADAVRAGIAVHMPFDNVLSALVASWCTRARAAARRVEGMAVRRQTHAELVARVPDDAALREFFQVNSRTFSFAARTFPREFRDRVTDVYAFCRVTDDLADAPDEPGADVGARLRRLELWHELARDAHAGRLSGIRLLDRVMGDAAEAGVPFSVVDELMAGMRMDLERQTYRTLAELRVYSFRVAGVVGQWMTRLSGVHDERVLARAADLGHAMQLTNIIRDVGEDLRVGRVYLPQDMLAAARIDETTLHAMAEGRTPISDAYRELLEQLMSCADEHYRRALDATPALPAWFRHPVRIAAHVYRGIHAGVRANGYDNLTRRARTGAAARLLLAMRALGGAALPHAGSSEAAVRVQRRARHALFALLLTAAAASVAPAAAQSAAQPAPSSAAETVPPAGHLARTVERVLRSPGDGAARLDLVRALFFVAVEEESAVVRGHAAIADIRTQFRDLAREREHLLTAYEGAFKALEAKHGFWPHARLSAVRRGLNRLDRAAAGAPGDLEIRYLRMINGFYLPSLFGRGDVVREDMTVLERDLAGAGGDYPAEIFRVMARFVLEHGTPTAEHAAALREAIDGQEPAS